MDSFNNAIDLPFKALGTLVAAGVVLFFVLNANQFNTLAGAAGTVVKDVATA